MPRYFFSVEDGGSYHDEDGHEFVDVHAARKEAMRALPGIARDEIAKGGDRQSFVMLVTDETGRPVYSAALNFTGIRLK